MKYSLFYTDSIGQRIQLHYQANSYNNLMEFISDQGLEEWGDCRGRAWCGTCQVDIKSNHSLSPESQDEQHRLCLLSNQTTNSRLACQILLDKNVDQAEVIYLGDD